MNQINVIRPYLLGTTWVFDDSEKGAHREALVGGTPQVIGLACEKFGVKNPQDGFTVVFSGTFFPDAQFSCKHVHGDASGNTYLWDMDGVQQEFWLCNFLLKYFETPPKELFIQVRN